MRLWIRALPLTLSVLGCQIAAAADAESRDVLVTGSPWRWHVTARPPVVTAAALRGAGQDAAGPAVLPVKLPWNNTPDPQNIHSDPPPAGWQAADFDDGGWPRDDGPFDAGVSVGLMCLRGRFLVTDPAQASGLTLRLGYRGGVVVYLNGREVARGHMPDGPVTALTPALPYPDEAYVDASGKALPHPHLAKDDAARRIATRDRSLGPVALPADALRRGVNVVAIECHRSDFHPIALSWWQTTDYAYGREYHWAPVGPLEIRLQAAGAGIVPNLGRPAGVQLYCQDIHQRITLDDYGDPAAAVGTIRLVGVRNGFYSGQVVLATTAAMDKVQAVAGDLRQADGTPVIPAAAIQVRYAVEGAPEAEMQGFCDALADQPPGPRQPGKRVDWRLERRRHDLHLPEPVPGVTQPIWITVHVPRDAAPGTYAGTLTVSADGVRPMSVPVELTVAAWTLTDPPQWQTHVGVFQSPTTLALRYGVQEWSEAHWKVMDKSFELLGEIGTKLVNIPISDRTQFGNDSGMVYLIRREGGGFDYDFTVFDRYLKLVRKHLGTPPFVALHVWHAGAWKSRSADEENTLTVVDPKTGKREHMQVPVFGTADSRAFWKPLLDEARRHLAAEGMADSMCLGILSDGTAPPEVFGMFAEVASGVGWTRGCHSTTYADAPYALPGGAKVVYHEFCYGGGIADPAKLLPKIYDFRGPGTDWRRGYRDTFPPITFRRLAERGLYARTRGFGRLGLDFWYLADEKGKERRYVFNRWPHSSVAGHGYLTIVGLAHPGPDGPMPTTRLELLREGVQEAEAMIFLCRAMDEHADRLGPELLAECRGIFMDRVESCRVLEGVNGAFFAGWQDRSRRLYEAAARVAAALD